MKNIKTLLVLVLICLVCIGIVPNDAKAMDPTETPVASPAGGAYATFPLLVTLSCATPDSTIFYTTDGSTPSPFGGNSVAYHPNNPIWVDAGQTLKAMARNMMYPESGVMSETYTLLTCAKPTANPPGGSYATFPQSVTLGCSTPGATIYYTTDGSRPTSASPVYSGAVSVQAGQTLNAIAILPNYADSAVMSETYSARIASHGSSGPEPDIQRKSNYEQAKIGHCMEWANVRSGPGENYDIIGRVYLGETIEISEWNKGETWCKVFYNSGNSIGWVHGKFIIPQR